MASSRIVLPERRRSYRFALTPLADAMFQLLIFFMLSTSLTPYSLLTVQSAQAPQTQQAAAAGQAQDAPEQPAASPQPDVALWTLEAETIIAGGQRFDFDALPDLAQALGAPGVPAAVILIVRPSARVQDITTVLATLRAAEVGSVQVSSAGSL